MLQARDYQQAAVDSIYKHFEAGYTGNPLITAPTGTGKSVIIAKFLHDLFMRWPTQRVIVATHVKELVEQNFNKFKTAWPQAPAGIFSAGLNKKQHQFPITFAGIQSVAKKAKLFGHIDLLIVDEAHRINPAKNTTYTNFINTLLETNPNMKVIGLTATDYRTGTGYIWGQENSIFERKCIDLCSLECFNWFVDQGYLAPVIPRRGVVEVNTDGLKVTGGDFNAKELEAAVNQDDITIKAIKQCIEECSDLDAWLIFASGVDHAKRIVELLEMHDITASAVYSGMEKDGLNRDEVISKFKKREIQALVNNNVLTTGFDDPGIKLIIMLRPTLSVGLWVQMVGRGTRPSYAPGFDLQTQEGRLLAIKQSDKPFCFVYDYCNNTKKLGPINDPRVPNRRKKKGGPAPIKECPQCGTLNHPKVVNCIYCGHEFDFEVKIKEQASNEKLIVNDLPVIEEFAVTSIQFKRNVGYGDKKDSVKVSYYVGATSYSEFVCFDHDKDSYPHKLARAWWRKRFNLPMPVSVDEALKLIDKGPAVTHIRVHTKTGSKKLKYPEIKAVCLDGSCFGKKEVALSNIEQEVKLSLAESVNNMINHDPNDLNSVPF